MVLGFPVPSSVCSYIVFREPRCQGSYNVSLTSAKVLHMSHR
jgi:hypothetical protein